MNTGGMCVDEDWLPPIFTTEVDPIEKTKYPVVSTLHDIHFSDGLTISTKETKHRPLVTFLNEYCRENDKIVEGLQMTVIGDDSDSYFQVRLQLEDDEYSLNGDGWDFFWNSNGLVVGTKIGVWLLTCHQLDGLCMAISGTYEEDD